MNNDEKVKMMNDRMERDLAEISKMSRIDEIKERHKPGSVIRYNTPWDVVALHKSDAEFLLSLNERYKQALEFYADEEKWEKLGDGQSYITIDGGECARKALEE